MVKKVKCKFAKCVWDWENTDYTGSITVEGKKEPTDYRGYWTLTGILCLKIKRDKPPFYWCCNPDKCEAREEGESGAEEFWATPHYRED